MRTVMRVTDTIMLCYLVDELKNVDDKFLSFANEFGREGVYYLQEISNEKFVLGKSKIKKFYQENKCVIDKINIYSNVQSFINYNYMGMQVSRLNNIFDYILENREEIDKIMGFLVRVKKLGFYEISIDTGYDFGSEEFEINKSIYDNLQYTFLEKINIKTNFDSSIVKYNGKGSRYKIMIQNHFGNDVISKEIYVNTLLIEESSLPKFVNKISTFDKIIGASSEKNKEDEKLRNCVLLDVKLEDLIREFGVTEEFIESLNLYGLKHLTCEIKAQLDKLYDEAISAYRDVYEDVDTETVEKEKKSYLKYRRKSSIILE